MPKRLRSRLTFANVVSCLALFVALGSGAYAAIHLPRNSVGARQLKKNSVTGAKVKNDSLTGSDILTSTLGTVPNADQAASAGHAATADNADTLQGIVPSSFVQGHGSTIAGRRDLVVAEVVPPIDLPGIVSLTAKCLPGPTVGFNLKNTSGGIIDVSASINSALPVFFILGNEGVNPFEEAQPFTVDLHLATRESPPVVATIFVVASLEGPKTCDVFTQAIIGA
jgi:hypothetical protein